jgi:hypothetical protein
MIIILVTSNYRTRTWDHNKNKLFDIRLLSLTVWATYYIIWLKVLIFVEMASGFALHYHLKLKKKHLKFEYKKRLKMYIWMRGGFAKNSIKKGLTIFLKNVKKKTSKFICLIWKSTVLSRFVCHWILFYFIFKASFLKLKQVGQLSQLDFTNNIFLI